MRNVSRTHKMCKCQNELCENFRSQSHMNHTHTHTYKQTKIIISHSSSIEYERTLATACCSYQYIAILFVSKLRSESMTFDFELTGCVIVIHSFTEICGPFHPSPRSNHLILQSSAEIQQEFIRKVKSVIS